jgi:hypothetical protein
MQSKVKNIRKPAASALSGDALEATLITDLLIADAYGDGELVMSVQPGPRSSGEVHVARMRMANFAIGSYWPPFSICKPIPDRRQHRSPANFPNGVVGLSVA